VYDDRINEICSCDSCLWFLQKHLLFLLLTDIVMPSSHLPVAKTDSLPQLSVDNCLLTVLNWNPNWLHEYGMSYFYAFVYIFVKYCQTIFFYLVTLIIECHVMCRAVFNYWCHQQLCPLVCAGIFSRLFSRLFCYIHSCCCPYCKIYVLSRSSSKQSVHSFFDSHLSQLLCGY